MGTCRSHTPTWSQPHTDPPNPFFWGHKWSHCPLQRDWRVTVHKVILFDVMIRMSHCHSSCWNSLQLDCSCAPKEANPYVLGHVHPNAHFVAFLRSLGIFGGADLQKSCCQLLVFTVCFPYIYTDMISALPDDSAFENRWLDSSGVNGWAFWGIPAWWIGLVA